MYFHFIFARYLCVYKVPFNSNWRSAFCEWNCKYWNVQKVKIKQIENKSQTTISFMLTLLTPTFFTSFFSAWFFFVVYLFYCEVFFHSVHYSLVYIWDFSFLFCWCCCWCWCRCGCCIFLCDRRKRIDLISAQSQCARKNQLCAPDLFIWKWCDCESKTHE